jgi:hypothetical protein
VKKLCIKRADGAERFTAPPCREIEILQLRIARADHASAGFRSNSEQ